MTAKSSLYGFAIAALIMETFFAIIYAFHEGYVVSPTLGDFNGLIIAIFLVMLLLIGFGLVSTYLMNFSITGLTLVFLILTFTIQWYFLVKKFWYVVNLGDTENTWYLGDNLLNIRGSGVLHSSGDTFENDMKFFTLSQAVACAISMFVILFPLLGRVGPFEVLVICFVGNFAYTLNELSFWRLRIQDNGYGMRIFLFGSTAGLLVAKIIGRVTNKNHPRYHSQYNFQTLGLLGAIFVWILLPWLSTIDQSQYKITTLTQYDFRQVAPLNIWYALSSSAGASFMTSIWIHGKISVHDVIFSCFSGAIAYGSSSNVFPNAFPAMLIGLFVGMLVTYLNSKKRSLNEQGVIDSLGSLFVFFIPSVIGAIYSAILFATSPYGPTNSDSFVQKDPSRDRWGQGGFQLIGMCITIGIALAAGVLIGLLMKIVAPQQEEEQFNDSAYIRKDNELVLRQSKIISA